MGMSVVQGGSGYPFFSPPIYDYICGTDLGLIIVECNEIPDPEIQSTIQKVRHQIMLHRVCIIIIAWTLVYFSLVFWVLCLHLNC